jgi:hypothetical protein
MKRQLFALLNAPDELDIPNGAIVEIVLSLRGGFDEFIMMDAVENVICLYSGQMYPIPKDWLHQFWMV